MRRSVARHCAALPTVSRSNAGYFDALRTNFRAFFTVLFDFLVGCCIPATRYFSQSQSTQFRPLVGTRHPSWRGIGCDPTGSPHVEILDRPELAAAAVIEPRRLPAAR